MKDFWNRICREAPDMAGGAPAQVDPAAAGHDAVAAASAQDHSDSAAAPAATDQAQVTAPVRKESPTWALKRISEESAKAQQAMQERDELRRQLEASQALIQRQQQGAGDQNHAPQQNQRQAVDPALVRAEAEQMRFNEDVNDIRARGFSEFGSAFNETINALGAVGAATPDFISDVLAVDKSNAHKIFKNLAEDPEKAYQLASMTTRQRIAELTRMTVASNKTADPVSKAADPTPARQVSRAPDPATRVVPSSSKAVPVYSDQLSDAEFTAQFNERMKARSAKR